MRKKIILIVSLFWVLIFPFDVFALSIKPLNDYYFSRNCPSDKPFTSRENGGCFGCDTTAVMTFIQENGKGFERCKNRENIFKEGGLGESRLKSCPPSYPLRDNIGSCVSCDVLESFLVETENDCNVCSNRYVRIEKYADEVEYYCQLKKCPGNAPLGRGDYLPSEILPHFYGDCLPCDTIERTKDSKDVCSKCPNREYVNGECKLIKESDPRSTRLLNEDDILQLLDSK